MVQTTSSQPCAYCGQETDELCDFCAFITSLAVPICSRHRYTRSPWAGELHTLCSEHEQMLHEARKGYIRDHQHTPQAREWRETQAYEYEPYLAPPPDAAH